MAYNVSIISPAEREARIKRAIASTTLNKKDFHKFRTSKIPLTVIRVPIGLPIYRMENFRTFTDQREYIAKVGVSSDFFIMGQESETVQQIQHEILTRLARKGKDGSITPVIDVLRKDLQDEPLLITENGIIVNGNRRLAAMRELYSEGTNETSSFADVELMVLPGDVTQDEIVDIEAILQGKPETKLDYDWIGDAQLIKAQLEIHKRASDVSKRLNRSERDIRNVLSALAEADLYLKDWANAEGEYSRVKDDAEQFFKDLPKSLEGKSALLENASRYIAWSLFDNRNKLPSRLYDYNSAFGKLAEDVLDRFSNTLGISIDENFTQANDDDFAIDIDGDESEVSYDAIINAIKDRSNENNITSLIDAATDSIETAKGQKSGDAALTAIMQANSKLNSVDLNRANPSTHDKIKKQLETITNITAKLLEVISKMTSK